MFCMNLSQIYIGGVVQNMLRIDDVYSTTQFVSAGTCWLTDECTMPNVKRGTTSLCWSRKTEHWPVIFAVDSTPASLSKGIPTPLPLSSQSVDPHDNQHHLLTPAHHIWLFCRSNPLLPLCQIVSLQFTTLQYISVAEPADPVSTFLLLPRKGRINYFF